MRVKGYVRWFDKLQGQGYVTDFDNNNYFLHWSEIPGAKFGRDKTEKDLVNVERYQLVSFKLGGSCSMGPAVTKMKILKDSENAVVSHRLISLLDYITRLDEYANHLGVYLLKDKLQLPQYRRVWNRLTTELKQIG